MKGGEEVKKSNLGFTMIELAVVLVLLGILGIALIPSMNMVYKQEIRKAADILCMDIINIRKQSMATGVQYELFVSDHEYTITPGIIQATSGSRTGNGEDSINKNIRYEIKSVYESGSTSTAGIINFKGSDMSNNVIAMGSTIDHFEIKVTYDSVAEYAEIIFYPMTGHYTITMKV